jgi:hypothetical protein
MAGILSLSPFGNLKPHPSLDSKLSELLAEVRGGFNYGDNSDEQLLSIHALLTESKGTDACVSSRDSSW